MKKVTLKVYSMLALVFIIQACSNITKEVKDNNIPYQKLDETVIKPVEKVKLIPIAEMDSTTELESYKFTKEVSIASKDLLVNLNDYQNDINAVDLASISKWAKEQMKGYKLPENFLTTLVIEGDYATKDFTALKIKVTQLPSHSPIVKRFLYLIPVYNSQKQIQKIFITIQGYAEE